MKKSHMSRVLCGSFVAGLVWVAGTGLAHAQFTQNRSTTTKIDSSAFPPDIQKGYRIFREKCNECHGLDTSLKMTLSANGWTSEVQRMQAMPSSQLSDTQAAAIIAFLNYDEAHRKSQTRAATESASDPISAGRAFYYAQNCDACHTIGGKGGAAGPPLDGVGQRLSREQLTERMRNRRAGTVMPPLPPDTTDEQIAQLVDFLMTLRSR